MNKRCYFIGTSGGTSAVASHFSALGRELAARGNNVKLLIPRTPDATLVGGENPEVMVWPSPRPTRLRDALFLAKRIQRFRPDCLMANFAAVNWMCLVGWLLRVKHRIAFYRTVWSAIELDRLNTPLARLKLLRLRKRFVYHLATNLVANSAASVTDLRSTYGLPLSKCTFQYLGLADPCGRFPVVPVEARDDSVLCVGRLHPSKGQDILIDAIARLGALANGTRFHFLGAGPTLEDLRRRAAVNGVAERCVFEGAKSHEEVLRRLSRAKAVVVTSRGEAFGLVNIEAFSVTTPVVASRVGGIPEIVRDGVEGLLFEPGNPSSLAGKLAQVLSDPELRSRLGGNGRKRFLQEFELLNLVGRQATFFQNLTA